MDGIEYNFNNFYYDSYSTIPNDILYNGSSPIILITDDLMFYSGNDFYTKKVYYNIKNNLNESITIHDAFKQIDNQVYKNIKNPILADYYNYNDHHFIEDIVYINDITFELRCGS